MLCVFPFFLACTPFYSFTYFFLFLSVSLFLFVRRFFSLCGSSFFFVFVFSFLPVPVFPLFFHAFFGFLLYFFVPPYLFCLFQLHFQSFFRLMTCLLLLLLSFVTCFSVDIYLFCRRGILSSIYFHDFLLYICIYLNINISQ